MNIIKQINKVRKYITKVVFVKTFNTNDFHSSIVKDVNEIRKILLIRPNHRLGNQLLITPLIQDVIQTFPNAKIHLFLKGEIGSIVFENYSEIETIIALPRKPFKNLYKYLNCFLALRKTKYDLVINTVSYSSSGNIATKWSNSKLKIFGLIDKNNFPNHLDYLHNAKRPVYDFREGLKNLNIQFNNIEISKILLKLDNLEIEDGRKKLLELNTNSKKTICVFTYATAEKMLSKEWWMSFYFLLKENFPDFNIIEILPVENKSQIDFITPSFYSKNIREMAALIENADLFIGADSGIMHLSNSTNTPTIGLFSVTKLKIYQPFGNQSFGIDVNQTNQQEIIDKLKLILE